MNVSISNATIRNILVFYTFLLSGITFFGTPTDGKNSFSAIIFSLLTFAAVYVFSIFYIKISEKAASLNGKSEVPASLTALIYIIGFAVCICLYYAYTSELSDTLPVISNEFESGRFSHFFVILSLILALYIGKRDFMSYSRICLLFLPVLIAPFVITVFNFIKYSADIKDIAQLLPRFSLEAKPEYFERGLALCGGIFAALIVVNADSEKPKVDMGLGKAFVVFGATAVAETIKYIFWFGADGLRNVSRPDRIMLSQVPFINIQELFLVSYYISYMLKISVYCTAARILMERALKKIVKKHAVPALVPYCVTAILAYTAYAVIRGVSDESASFGFMAVFQIILFVGMILHELLKILAKKYKNDGNTSKTGG